VRRADYSGVSRTLTTLRQEEAEQVAGVLAKITEPHWLATQCPQLRAGWKDSMQPKVKEQVKVGAHTSAWVHWQEQGCLLKFTDASVFTGRSLHVERQWVVQLPLPFGESLCLGRF